MKSNINSERIENILNQIREAQNKKANAQLSASSYKFYETDNRLYQEWCSAHGYNPYPSDEGELTIYIVTMVLEGYKSSTILRKLASIRHAHFTQGYPPPNTKIIYSIIDGSKIALETGRESKKKISKKDLDMMIDSIPRNLKGVRDKGLLLLAYHSKLLREEIVTLNVEDLEFSNDKKNVRISYWKNGVTNQGRNQKREALILNIQKENCPVLALKEWLANSGLLTGALFRPINKNGGLRNLRLSGKSVANIVKEYARKAGLDERLYSSSSFK
ncbi:tyrosine-type recombinase/integrase [Paenibacillus xylanexedens]|uniref:tyrosine-type recombinase/integrase n=1 Tax=Paenibacillus xylanexedens TaxID=528191 RepID=UPI0011A25F9B|nr:tyrosine-type recombinase/integrase [Paenibacillus xylanexedens]